MRTSSAPPRSSPPAARLQRSERRLAPLTAEAPDEEPSGLQRVLLVADTSNGLSSELDLTHWHFINPELSVHLHRETAGEWVCVDATTTITPGGAGLATTVLSDAGGPVGVGAQALLVAPRSSL